MGQECKGGGGAEPPAPRSPKACAPPSPRRACRRAPQTHARSPRAQRPSPAAAGAAAGHAASATLGRTRGGARATSAPPDRRRRRGRQGCSPPQGCEGGVVEVLRWRGGGWRGGARCVGSWCVCGARCVCAAGGVQLAGGRQVGRTASGPGGTEGVGLVAWRKRVRWPLRRRGAHRTFVESASASSNRSTSGTTRAVACSAPRGSAMRIATSVSSIFVATWRGGSTETSWLRSAGLPGDGRAVVSGGVGQVRSEQSERLL